MAVMSGLATCTPPTHLTMARVTFQGQARHLNCHLVRALNPTLKPAMRAHLTKEKMMFKGWPLRLVTLLLVMVVSSSARAQVYANEAEWKESEVPPPPAFNVKKLLTFEVPRISSLVYGVDPASVSISQSDSLVRYVMVATSPSGATSVMYEALRCSTGEFKTYARYSSDGKWNPVTNPEWRSVFASMASKHPLWFAKAGACDAAAPVGSIQELITKLKNPGRYLDQ